MEPATAPNTNWLQIISDPQNASLDIVAVHGMNVTGSDGHSENTWTENESNTHWLRDFLPELLPRARILAYQYNANVVFKASVAGIKEQAINLLHCLQSERRGPQENRPIIFIAHSMGGILVKEAMATAFHDPQFYSMLWIFTYGMVFFGVPHKGSEYATWGGMATRIVQLFTGQPNRSFLSSVEKGSSYNVDLSERFSPLLNAFKFWSICETVPERFVVGVGLIVDIDSATLGLPASQEVKLYPNRTHRTICKFARRSEPEWTQIADIIASGAARAAEFTGYSPNMTTRKMTILHSDEMALVPYSIQQAIHQAQLVLTASERLHGELVSEEEVVARDEVQGAVSWVMPILIMFGFLAGTIVSSFFPILSFLPILPLLPAHTIMERAERARQGQERLVEFQQQAIERLDSNRGSILGATVGLQSLFADGEMLPNELLHELSLQVRLTVSDMERRYRVLSEETRRLRRIEDGQREAQGMNDREVVELLGRYAQEERDRLMIEPSEEAWNRCPTDCIIL